MALPNTDDIVTLDYSFLGQPFGNLPAKAGLDMTSLDYSFLGQPFYTNPDPVPPVSSSVFGFVNKKFPFSRKASTLY